MKAGSGAQAVAVMDTYDIAQEWNVTPRWVRALAADHGIGKQTHGGIWVFLPDDVERLSRTRRPVGRPPLNKETHHDNNGQRRDSG